MENSDIYHQTVHSQIKILSQINYYLHHECDELIKGFKYSVTSLKLNSIDYLNHIQNTNHDDKLTQEWIISLLQHTGKDSNPPSLSSSLSKLIKITEEYFNLGRGEEGDDMEGEYMIDDLGNKESLTPFIKMKIRFYLQMINYLSKPQLLSEQQFIKYFSSTSYHLEEYINLNIISSIDMISEKLTHFSDLHQEFSAVSHRLTADVLSDPIKWYFLFINYFCREIINHHQETSPSNPLPNFILNLN